MTPEKIKIASFEFDGDRIQNELAKTKSNIDQVAQAISILKKESKDYSKEVIELATAQAILQKAGKSNTKEFKENAKKLEELKQKHESVTLGLIEMEKNKKNLDDTYRSGIKVLQAHLKIQDINIDNYKTEGKSIRQLRDENKALIALRNELKTTTGEESLELKKLNSVIDQNTNAQKENVNEQQKRFYQIGQYNEQLSGSLTGIKDSIDALKSGDFTGFASGVKEGFTGMKAAANSFFVSLLANPITAIVVGLAALATGAFLAAKKFINYNQSIEESILITEQMTNVTGKAADSIRNQARAISDTFGTEFKDNLKAAKSLVEDFGISYDEAFEMIKTANVTGANSTGELFENINEFGGLIANAGYDAKQFIGILNAGIDLDIYKNKLPDAIKEASISLTEQTDATREALTNAFGAAFTDDILNRIKNGKTTVAGALNEIAEISKKTGLNNQQYAQLTADIFRGAGEDAGGAVKIFEALTLATENAEKPLNKLEKATLAVADSQIELRKAKDSALKSDTLQVFLKVFTVVWNKVKTTFFTVISFIKDNFGSVFNDINRVVQEFGFTGTGIFDSISKSFGFLVKNFVRGFTTVTKFVTALSDRMIALSRSIKTEFSGIINLFKTTGADIRQALQDFLDPTKTVDFKGIKERFVQNAKDIGGSYIDELNKVQAQRSLREFAAGLSLPEASTSTPTPQTETTNTTGSKTIKNAQKKLDAAKENAKEVLAEVNAALLESAEISAQRASQSLTTWIANNASRLADENRLTDELVNQEMIRLDNLGNVQSLALEKEKEAAELRLEQEISLLESKKSLSDSELITLQNLNDQKLLLNAEYAEKEAEQLKNIQKLKDEAKAEKALQDSEDEKLSKAIAFENEMIRLEEQDATRFELEREREAEHFRLQKEALDEKLNSGKISRANYEAALVNITQQSEQQQTEIKEKQTQARLASVANTLGSVSELLGKNTAAGKAAGIAQATINTYQGVTEVWKSESVLPEPFATIAKIANTAVVLASGLKAVNKIRSVKLPKGYATGGLIDDGLPISRSNGDDVLITAKRGEVILNQPQQELIGINRLAMAGVPGIAYNNNAQMSSINNANQTAEIMKQAIIEGAIIGTQLGSKEGIKSAAINTNISKLSNHG